ncbi:unnamed protein product [Clavelina lepadiformis]|uniref:PH domain-containing protein n=1 Tax=Clavelina lepadiformis TaxID=159417 RepID=A0ABP0GB54_CLALP
MAQKYDVRNEGIVMEGFLIKRGHVRNNWKTRWFRLSESSLRYYKNKKSSVPRGRVPLGGATLLTTNVFQDGDADDVRVNVFKVTTSSGIEYPIQATSSSEFQTWTDAICDVIYKLDSNNSEPKIGPSKTSSMEDVSTIHHADKVKKALTTQDGVVREARVIEGIRYTQGFSGMELQRWVWKNMGVTGSEAEDRVKGLIRVGLLQCMTSEDRIPTFSDRHYYTLLTNESSLKAMSTAYVNNIKLQTTAAPSKHDDVKHKNKKIFASKDVGELPSDLPPGDVIKRGILFKRGHIVPSWKARCFVLQGFPAALSYFDPAKKSPNVIKSLSLYGASVFSVSPAAAQVALKMQDAPENLFCLKLKDGTLYLITAASEEEKTGWIRAIKPLCARQSTMSS